MEKLSIIVPVYNVFKYLEECVDSLINQYYSNCEIIIVDDGSSDGSSVLCDELKKRDERIIVIHQDNKGLSAARNAGLRVADGCYVCFIDSDDVVAPNIFLSLINLLENSHSSVAICNFEVFNKKDRYKSYRYGNEIIEYTSESQVSFYSAALDSSCNRVFCLDVIKNNKLFFEHKSIVAQEDFWFQIRYFSHISRIVTMSDCLYLYRERGSSITKSHSDGDITERNLNFYSLTNDYVHVTTNREITDFLNYLLANLFTSSINNLSKASPKVIEEMLYKFENNPHFSSAISAKSISRIYESNSIRDMYSRLSFGLLRNGFRHTFSILEAVRLSRLRSNSRTDLYFE